ncbi:hypothetical protein D3C81_909540 [compost metagenome]
MRGAKLQPFEKTSEQLAYEQAVASWQQVVAGAAAALAEAAKSTEPPMTPEQLQAAANQIATNNPMPKPEDYNFDPAQPTLSKTSPLTPNVPSILDQMQQTVGTATQNAQGAVGQGAMQPNSI